MTLLSEDGSRNFSAFMRKNEDLPENFSIGLNYYPNDLRGEITLLRCNGPHGLYNENFAFDPAHPHWDYHIHKASEQAMDAGFRADKYAVKTGAYASYEEALPYFLKRINVNRADVDRYFPNIDQDILKFGQD